MLFSKTQSLYKRLEGAVALKDRNKKMKKKSEQGKRLLIYRRKEESQNHADTGRNERYRSGKAQRD